MRSLFLWLTLAILITSCGSKPTEADIRQKLLTEYVCPETVLIRHFEIVRDDEIKNEKGQPVHRYLVRGQMEWPGGCTDEDRIIPAGRQESFEQTVFLSKGDNGHWQ